MAARGFADITPDRAENQAPASRPGTEEYPGGRQAESGPGRDRAARVRERVPWVWVGAAVAALLLIAVLAGAWPGGDGPGAASVRAAHGPTRIVDGVPTGYTRDEAGAATAAVNIVQALTQAGQGRVAMSAVVAALIAPGPGPELSRSIEIGRDRPADAAILNVLPAAVTVTALTDSSAEVTVWTMGVSRASITPGDPVAVMTLWTTNTVSLIWDGGDWKAREKTGHVGPTPEEVLAPNSSSALTKPLVSGYYTFYLN